MKQLKEILIEHTSNFQCIRMFIPTIFFERSQSLSMFSKKFVFIFDRRFLIFC